MSLVPLGRTFGLAGILTALAVTGAGAQSVVSVPLPASSLVYVPGSGKLYASVPANGPAGRANSITEIDPQTGALGPSVFIGSDPGKLVVSAGEKYLYVVVGGGNVRRFDLASRSAGPQFALGGGLSVTDLQAVADDPESVLVMRQNRMYSPSDEGVALYTGGIPHPGIVKAGHSLAPGIVPSRFYGYENQISSFALTTMQLNAQGVNGVNSAQGVLSGNIGIVGANGLLFTTNGGVLDPEAKITVGRLPDTGTGAMLCPDPSVGKVFQLVADRGGTRIVVYDVRTSTRAGVIPLPAKGGVGNFLRWGTGGFAFTSGGEIVLARADLGAPLPRVDLSVTRTGMPRNLRSGMEFTYRLTVRNEAGGNSSGAFVSDAFPEGVEVLSVKASQGSATVTGRVVHADLGALVSLATATVDVNVRLNNPDRLALTAIVRGNEPDPSPGNNLAALDLAPPPSQVADLTGSWRSLGQNAVGAGVNLRAVIGGVFIVRNDGQRPAGASRLRFYLAETPRFNVANAQLLQEVIVPALGPGRSVAVTLQAPLDPGDDATGFFVAAIVNSTGDVEEENTKNNTVVERIR